MSAKVSFAGDFVKSECSCKGIPPTRLDTLAQLRTKGNPPPVEDDFEVSARTTKSDKRTLLKRARRNYATTALSLLLVDTAKSKGSLLYKSYWNSFYCSSTLTESADGKIRGKYCKCRWCLVCNSIRTAQHINNYGPIVDTWSNAQFVTLTEKNCKGVDLSDRITAMTKLFTGIKEVLYRRYRRGRSAEPLVGIRKLECTYNPYTDEYNPHFHLIIKDPEHAEFVRSEWLKRNELAGEQGQQVKPCEPGTLPELFKYMTKLLIGGKSEKKLMHTSALDTIFQAMKGRRTIQNFGFKVGKGEEEEEEPTDVTEEDVVAVLQWCQEGSDWYYTNGDNAGEGLTGYQPSEGFREIFNPARPPSREKFDGRPQIISDAKNEKSRPASGGSETCRTVRDGHAITDSNRTVRSVSNRSSYGRRGGPHTLDVEPVHSTDRRTSRSMAGVPDVVP